MYFENGICGTYIRPEDVPAYEPYVHTIEFVTDTLKKEAVLFNTYKTQNWPGNLNLLLTNLNYHIDNRGFDDNFGKTRINCGQKCMRTGTCHYCERAFMLNTMIDKNKKEILSQAKEDN